MKFYKCEHCGNIIFKIDDKNVPVSCCGEYLKEMTLASIDASLEKHLPKVSIQAETVTVDVGEVEHPMIEEHSIKWVCLEVENGFMIQYLGTGEVPRAIFKTNQKVKSVYSYCNLHGLWQIRI